MKSRWRKPKPPEPVVSCPQCGSFNIFDEKQAAWCTRCKWRKEKQ